MPDAGKEGSLLLTARTLRPNHFRVKILRRRQRVGGIAMGQRDDDARLARSSAVLDDLHGCYQARQTARGDEP